MCEFMRTVWHDSWHMLGIIHASFASLPSLIQ